MGANFEERPRGGRDFPCGSGCGAICPATYDSVDPVGAPTADWRDVWCLWQAVFGESQYQLLAFGANTHLLCQTAIFLGSLLHHWRDWMRDPCSLSCPSWAGCYFDPLSHQVRFSKRPNYTGESQYSGGQVNMPHGCKSTSLPSWPTAYSMDLWTQWPCRQRLRPPMFLTIQTSPIKANLAPYQHLLTNYEFSLKVPD